MLNKNIIEKYKPKKLDEIIGQDEIIHSLINSIKNKNFYKFLFFIGKEGVGKNTCANILAKNINKYFSEKENTYNLYKLYRIFRNPFKETLLDKFFIKKNNNDSPNIFIFNNFNITYLSNIFRLIKVNNSIFIFCIKEKKFFNLIVEKYQSFIFKDISEQKIFSHINMIVKKEKIQIEKDALYTISKYSNGSIGKAITILNNIYLNKNIITNNYIINKLGIIDKKDFFILVDYLLNNDINKALTFIKKIFLEKEIKYFIIGLKKHFRNLFLSKNFNKSLDFIKKKEILEYYVKQSKNISYYILNKALYICSDLEQKYFLYKNIEFNIKSLIETSIIQLSYYFSKKLKINNNNKIIFFKESWNNFIHNIPKNLLSNELINSLINDTKFKILNNKTLLIVISCNIENNKLSLINKNFYKFYKNRIDNLFFNFKIEIENKNDNSYLKNKFLNLFIKRIISNNS
ncbi:hypothetical protein [Blattabacterium cuenoti]|uniref:hypothetical protein n=1 Tax=Blattabacterium cuenoti TaxID=1653831 RepID=UPI00163C09CF|nr:hypothetical protein [Blattabacterium cuenoti]